MRVCYDAVMKIDATAGIYGLFQVVFADLTDHLAFATFRLGSATDSTLKFEDVFRQEFGNILRQFRTALRQFSNSPVDESMYALNEACNIMSRLSKWRNDRVHVRVRMTSDGYALYDWRTGNRLPINYGEVE